MRANKEVEIRQTMLEEFVESYTIFTSTSLTLGRWRNMKMGSGIHYT